METPATLFIILGAISGVIQGDGVLPNTLTGMVGGAVMFNTTVPPAEKPFVAVTWGFKSGQGQPVNIITSGSTDTIGPAYTGRVKLLRSTGSLELGKLTVTDTGDYKVTIVNGVGLPMMGSCKLLVHEPISNVLVSPSGTDLVEFNSSVALSCSAAGSSLTFQWMNGSSEVTASDRVQLSNGGSTLTIVNVMRYDRGPFACRVHNPVSDGSSDPVNLSISYGPDTINVTRQPPQDFYSAGSNVSLSCSAVSTPAAQYHWFLNGQQLSDSGPELRLIYVQESQSGSYSCRAFNNKTLRSLTAQLPALTVLVPVFGIVVNSSSTELVEFNSSVTLSCASSGSAPSFLWMNGSSEITASDRVHVTDGNSSLTVYNVTRYDQGPFRCRVSNPVSDGSSDPVTLLIVLGPENLNLTASPSQEYYDEGSDVTLTCSVVSTPPAHIHWFMNGDKLSETGPELRLSNMKLGQSGNYSCRAFNNKTMGSLTSQPVVIAIQRSNISDVTITSDTTDLVEFNSSARLSCSASGSSLSFLWLNGTAEVTAGDRVQIGDAGTSLHIANVTRYDPGPYRCHAFNAFSNSSSRPLELSVSFGPENTNLELFPSQQYYEEGAEVKLTCSAMSTPAALYQWFRGGEKLSASGPALTLMKMKQSDSGKYNCQAFNNKTLRYETSEATLVLVLAPVSNVTVTPSTGSSDLLEFMSSVSLSCSSSGSSLSFVWMNGSSEMTAGDRVQLTDGNSNLTIVNVTRYDQGPFRCNVSNGVNIVTSKSVHLIIQYGPDNVTTVGPESAPSGTFTMLYCSTESVPPAQFTWLFEGRPTEAREAVFVIRSSQTSHSGTYTCTAENTVTGTNQTVHHRLTVTDSSECDCAAAASGASIITAVCIVAIVAVCGIILYCLVRKKKINSIYPARLKQKLSERRVHPERYQSTRANQSSLANAEFKFENTEKEISTSI